MTELSAPTPPRLQKTRQAQTVLTELTGDQLYAEDIFKYLDQFHFQLEKIHSLSATTTEK